MDVCDIHFFWDGEEKIVIELLKKYIPTPWEDIFNDKSIDTDVDILRRYLFNWNMFKK